MQEINFNELANYSMELSDSVKTLLYTTGGSRHQDSVAFDVNSEIPNLGVSTLKIATRTLLISDMLNGFIRNRNPSTISRHLWHPLIANIEEMIKSTNKLRLLISELFRQDNNTRSFNFETFSLANSNGEIISTLPIFLEFYERSESLIEAFTNFTAGVDFVNSFDDRFIISSLESIIQQAQTSLANANILVKNSNDKEQEINSVLIRSEELYDKVKSVINLVENERHVISENSAHINEQKAVADAVVGQTKHAVSSYQQYMKELSSSKKEIASKLAWINDQKENIDSTVGRVISRELDIETVIAKSEKMLSSATVAGLAANFAKINSDLTKELGWARVAFYCGIVFLVLSALPLLIFVLMPITPLIEAVFKWLFPQIQVASPIFHQVEYSDPWQYVGLVIARIAVLLPAAWLVSFAAIRHSSLFRLREHYAYKYSMAVAVEGFKQQAPAYQEEIAALVLEQLAFNPADKLIPSKDIVEGRAPGIAGFLLAKIRENTSRSSTEE